MRYYLFKAGEKEYKLRLTAQNIIDTERRLGGSVLDVLMKADEGKMPSTEELLTILQGSIQEYDENEKKICDIYDEYIEEGGDYTGLIEVITEVMKISGFFREKKREGRKAARLNSKI